MPYHCTVIPRYSHNPISNSRYALWLQIQPEHSGHGILSRTTTRKGHWAGMAAEHGYCRLQEGLRYNLENQAMTATKKVWVYTENHSYNWGSTYGNSGKFEKQIDGLPRQILCTQLSSGHGKSECPLAVLENHLKKLERH